MNSKYMRAGIKHFFKSFIGKRDAKWDFYNFEFNVKKETWECHDQILKWAEQAARNVKKYENEEAYKKSEDPIIRQWCDLSKKVLDEYKGKYEQEEKWNFIIHIPPANESPAGYSLFSNMADGFDFMGLDVQRFYFNDDIKEKLNVERKNVLLTSDCDDYLKKINWAYVKKYRENADLYLGLTASPGYVGKKSLKERLKEASEYGVNFYYCYDDLKYCKDVYKDFFDAGYTVIGIPFGANILKYYPIPNIEKNINYTFLASSNRDKWNRYLEYLPTICKEYSGFISGPGWTHIHVNDIQADRDRYIYARTKVGLNLHLDMQISTMNQLNERTYMLASCGIPQVIDRPAILLKYFSQDSFFIAENGKEYYDLFKEALVDFDESEKRALKAQKETLLNHTTFHRIDDFFKDIDKIIV